MVKKINYNNLEIVRQVFPDANIGDFVKWGKKDSKRTLPQNKYFHGVVCKIIADELGYTLEELKAELGYYFYPIYVNGKRRSQSSSNLTTKEMTAAIDKIRLWASEDMNIEIPLPNEIPEEVLIRLSYE